MKTYLIWKAVGGTKSLNKKNWPQVVYKFLVPPWCVVDEKKNRHWVLKYSTEWSGKSIQMEKQFLPREWWWGDGCDDAQRLHNFFKPLCLQNVAVLNLRSLCPGVEPSSRPVCWNRGKFPIYQQGYLFVILRQGTRNSNLRILPMRSYMPPSRKRD